MKTRTCVSLGREPCRPPLHQVPEQVGASTAEQPVTQETEFPDTPGGVEHPQSWFMSAIVLSQLGSAQGPADPPFSATA